MRPFVSFLFLGIALMSCQPKNNLLVDTSQQPNIPITIHRYEKELFTLDPAQLKTALDKIANEFRFFLGNNYADTVNQIQLYTFITDKRIREVYHETTKKYPTLTPIEEDLAQAFKYYTYYFPTNKIPKVYSYVSDLYYEKPIIYADSVLIIALDMYLGKTFPMYAMLGLPQYKTALFDQPYLAKDCFVAIYQGITPPSNPKTLLDYCIEEGKKYYFLEAMFPHMQDSITIGYTTNQLNWCQENNYNIWSFLVEKQLLFKTDKQIITKFINDAPFTTGFEEASPGRIGAWVGWQIVRAYMKENPTISMSALIHETNAQQILTLSGYKPKK